MSVTPHSLHAYLVVDPVQDYEESDQVLGVYGSVTAALVALPRLRRKPGYRNGWGDKESRYLEVQHWAGDTLVTTTRVYDNGRTEWRAE